MKRRQFIRNSSIATAGITILNFPVLNGPEAVCHNGSQTLAVKYISDLVKKTNRWEPKI